MISTIGGRFSNNRKIAMTLSSDATLASIGASGSRGQRSGDGMISWATCTNATVAELSRPCRGGVRDIVGKAARGSDMMRLTWCVFALCLAGKFK